MTDIQEKEHQPCAGCGAMLDTTDEEPLAEITCPACGVVNSVTSMVGPFEMIEMVGQGGMGVVYKARDASLDRMVALKLLRRGSGDNAEQIEKLATEAAITASINHPHVVRVFTTGTDRGRFYLAMELVDKGTLDNLITLQGRVAEAQVLDVGIQIAEGLRAAYQAGLIHRDVKPGNILFADARTAKIVDFGLAIFQVDEEQARTGEVWGTPYYVAPEKLDSKPEDFRSDIYSLGATLFHALAGRPPFEAEDASMVALKHLKGQAVSLQAFAPWVSGPTNYVINKTLSKDPEQRHQSYDELIEQLEYARAELEKKGAQPAQAQRVVLEGAEEQNTMGWVTIGLFTLVLVSVGGYFLFRGGDGGASRPASAALVGAASATKYDADYEKARQLLIAGKPADAAAAFATLGKEKLPQPMLNWANLHEGLAQFAAGNVPAGSAAFHRIAERGLYSSAPEAAKLANFFNDTALLAQTDGPVAPSEVGTIDNTSHEALGLLAFGLKDWQLEKFEDAGLLLRQFDGVQPGAGAEWVRQYRQLAADYLSDFAEYREASEAMKVAQSPSQKRTAAKVLDSAKANLKLGGALATKIAAMRKSLGEIPPPPKPAAAKKLAADSTWTTGDVGATEFPGDAKFDAAKNSYTIRGSGDVWANSDACHFLWQPLAGDGQIVARVASVTKGDPWTKAGLMLREKPAGDSRNVFVAVTPGNGVTHQRRIENKQSTTSQKFPGVGAPQWLKLVRAGEKISTFRSSDGETWTLLATDKLPRLPASLIVGLAVASHNNTSLGTATFDSVTVSKGALP